MSASFGPALRNILASRPARTMMANKLNPTIMMMVFVIVIPVLSTGKTVLEIGGFVASGNSAQIVCDFVPAAHPGDALLIAHHHYFRIARNRQSIFTARCSKPAGGILREQNLARAMVANGAAYAAYHADRRRLLCCQLVFMRRQHMRHKPEQRSRPCNSGNRRQQQHDRNNKSAIPFKQI